MWRDEGRAIGGVAEYRYNAPVRVRIRVRVRVRVRVRQAGVQCVFTWHGSMPGNHAQVGLIRLFGGRSSAARTTFSLNAWSYVVRFFLVREPAGDEVGVGINKGTFGPRQGFVADDA